MNIKRWRKAAAAVAVLALIGGGSAFGASLSGGTLSLSAGDTVTATCPNRLSTSARATHSVTLSCAPNPTTTTTTGPATTTMVPVTTTTTTTVAPTTTTTIPTSNTCTNPSFVTSAAFGGQTFGSYFLYNNEWNASGHVGSQTMYVCNYNNWYVIANWTDNGSHAVLTYPNVQANFSSVPISSFSSLTSTFAESDPHVGIYEDAYDMWINGLATAGSTEIMIWNNNFGQTPGGSFRATLTLDGRSYNVYQGGSYIAFVAATNFTSGTINMLPFYDYVIAQGWMPASSVLDQIDYGVELVSTNGTPQTFTFDNFSVNSANG